MNFVHQNVVNNRTKYIFICAYGEHKNVDMMKIKKSYKIFERTVTNDDITL